MDSVASVSIALTGAMPACSECLCPQGFQGSFRFKQAPLLPGDAGSPVSRTCLVYPGASLSSWGNLEKSGSQRYCPEGWWQWGFPLRELLGTPMTAGSARREVVGRGLQQVTDQLVLSWEPRPASHLIGPTANRLVLHPDHEPVAQVLPYGKAHALD